MDVIRKYNLIKKILVPIVMVAIFLLPISPSLNLKDNNLAINFEKNKAKASGCENSKDKDTSTCFMLNAGTIKQTTADFEARSFIDARNYTNFDLSYVDTSDPKEWKIFTKVTLKERLENEPKDNPAQWTGSTKMEKINLDRSNPNSGQKIPLHWEGLKPGTDYFFSMVVGRPYDAGGTIATKTFFTTGTDTTLGGSQKTTTVENNATQSLDLKCGIGAYLPGPAVLTGEGTISGCVAALFWLVFELAALIGRLAGHFLDFFVYYSTSSLSYKSDFINEGWKAIRDVSNIFFIIALLYIAIKTILGIGVSENKKLISYIVIIGLLINFSLFFTQVIIDSTNILAKIFYNNISAVDKAGEDATDETGAKSISVGLMAKFNPQVIISQDVYDASGGTTLFIFTTIIAIFVVLYAAWIFFSVAILFVSRVVALWIYMIFSPIAFASYTLPFDIPGFGHKEWWDEVLKNAFLAPIFIFFLYIIVMFTGFLSSIVSFPEGASTVQKAMAVIIPFAILAILLTKAKELAVKYAGEMGKAVSKAGAVVGGLALGAAAGGLALAGRGTLGALGSKMANSSALAKLEAGGGGMGKFGKMMGTGLRNVGMASKKGSFDVRGIKIAGKDLSSTGMSGMKAGGQGGYEKAKADKKAKREKRAEGLKKAIEEGEKGKKAKVLEENLKALENALNPALDAINKDIEIAKEKLQNAKNANDKPQIDEQYKRILDLQNTRDKIKKDGADFVQDEKTGEVTLKQKQLFNADGTPKQKEVKTTEEVEEDEMREVKYTDPSTGAVRIEHEPTGKKIKVMKEKITYEDDYENIRRKDKNGNDEPTMKELANSVRTAKNAVIKEQNEVATDYAQKITRKKLSNLYGLFSDADKDAAHDIKMGVKAEHKPEGKGH